MVRCLSVTRPETHGEKYRCIYPLQSFSAADEFDGADPGEKITVELIEMTQEDFDKMDDFAGW